MNSPLVASDITADRRAIFGQPYFLPQSLRITPGAEHLRTFLAEIIGAHVDSSSKINWTLALSG
jgi:hypothetical protein